MNKVLDFIKKEAVFTVAFIACVVSCFFVKISPSIISYIDWNTIFMLFSLMSVVAGLKECNVFKSLCSFLCNKVHNIRALSAVLVFLCFILSMFITNDVALITFVPFAVLVLSQCGADEWIIMYTVVLETIAANTGSMLTPLGNPQNLFLFGKMSCTISYFLLKMLPFTLFSAFLLLLSLLVIPAVKFSLIPDSIKNKKNKVKKENLKIIIYILLFAYCLLSVLGITPKWSAAVLTVLLVLAFDIKLFVKVDYMLLFTFIAFFIFTGNIQQLDKVREFLTEKVSNNECITSVITSQIISNVPSALLLEPFSKNNLKLLYGVNIGGLGTLVASLASLISFKAYTRERSKGTLYLILFTIMNIVFLFLLLVLYFIFVKFNLI